MSSLKILFNKITEGVAVAMLATLFVIFVLQIFSRYVLGSPIGWTLEITLTLWVWIVFWGNSFNLRHDQHVIFDLLYLKASPTWRKVFSLLSSGTIVVGMLIAFYPTWDFIDFLAIRDSAVLHIPMNQVFSVYMVFMVTTILIYTWRFIKVLKHGVSEEDTPKQEDSNL